MKITCPNCGFERSVDENALPSKAVMATCPKCTSRFKFRELPVPPAPQPAPMPVEPVEPPLPRMPAAAEPEPLDLPEDIAPLPSQAEGDLWRELEALREQQESEEEEPEFVEPSLPVWEKATGGYPLAFGQTFFDMMSNPKRFFSAMPVGNGLTKPLLFFLIIIEVVAVSQATWQLLGILPPSVFVENLGHSLQAAVELILYPLQFMIYLFLTTAINHFFLRLFKADTKGFEGTFRVATYSAATMLFLVIPYIGIPLAMITETVYKFLGLKHVHRATNKQVAAVLVLPMLLIFGVALFLTLLTGVR